MEVPSFPSSLPETLFSPPLFGPLTRDPLKLAPGSSTASPNLLSRELKYFKISVLFAVVDYIAHIGFSSFP